MEYSEKARTILNGVLCHYGLRTFTKVWTKRSWTNHCPICNLELKLNDEFYLVINNFNLFPNSLVHAKCIVKPSSTPGLFWMDFYDATERIYADYKMYKELYKAWIRKCD